MKNLFRPMLMSFDSILWEILIGIILKLGTEVEGLRCLSREWHSHTRVSEK